MLLYFSQDLNAYDMAEMVHSFSLVDRLPPGVSYERVVQQTRVHARNLHAISRAKILDAMRRLPYRTPETFRPTLCV